MELPLDVKFIIASFDIDVWIRLSYIDDEFKQFSYGVGRKLFIKLFTINYKNISGSTSWKIFGKFHSFGDKPAVILSDGTKIWYQNNRFHRDSDLPAVIFFSGRQEWWVNGKLHRDDNKPANYSFQ